MGLVVISSLAIGAVVLVLFLAVRADRRHRRGLDGIGPPRPSEWQTERRHAEERFVQALEVQDFDRAETELRTILSQR